MIWFGGPLPADCAANWHLWQKLHPGWEFRLWNDEDATKELRAQNMHEELALMRRLPSRAAQSDIFRLLLLKMFGGVYIDGDMEPVRNIEPLLASNVGCFVGWEEQGQRINNAIIGATGGHFAICDALDGLRGHLENAETDKRDAAHATGPFYLNSTWKDDERVTKFPKEVFYPYDWHEPWLATAENLIGPDTYAIHRWDASWIDEVTRPQKELRRSMTMGCVIVGATDSRRRELAWGSHVGQTIARTSVRYYHETVDRLCSPENLRELHAKLLEDGVNRVLFVPADHVLDPNTIEVHAWMPRDVLAVTHHRLFSSEKLFSLSTRKADRFPYEVFRFHGWQSRKGIRPMNSWLDVQEVFSINRNTFYLAIEYAEKHLFTATVKEWSHCASSIAQAASAFTRFAFTYGTRTTKLCQHPVNEKAGDPHIAQWDGRKIILPKAIW